jgi:P27 family predicted phage terminase small subunit
MRGTYRADRHADTSEHPQFDAVKKLPPAPPYLDKVGKGEWRRIGPQLLEQQLLTTADLAAFAAYCANVSRAVEAEQALRKHGLTMLSPQGIIPRPEVNIAKAAWAEVRKFAQEFGLTPSARTRVRGPSSAPAPTEKPADPWGAVAEG